MQRRIVDDVAVDEGGDFAHNKVFLLWGRSRSEVFALHLVYEECAEALSLLSFLFFTDFNCSLWISLGLDNGLLKGAAHFQVKLCYYYVR